MGLVLDSSVLIASERRTMPVSDLLQLVRAAHGSTNVLLSAISVIELEHGLWRASSTAIANRRRQYLDTIYAAVPIEPFTQEIAQRAARIDAEARNNGSIIPFADLQIGTTALHVGYALLTGNVRHFEMIPGLVVHKFPAI